MNKSSPFQKWQQVFQQSLNLVFLKELGLKVIEAQNKVANIETITERQQKMYDIWHAFIKD